MDFVYDDGGRKEAGYKGTAGDCVCRAVAIAAQLPYKQVYRALCEVNAKKFLSGRNRYSARNGIDTNTKAFWDYMQSLGFTWHPIMKIGSGCTVHLKSNELPQGRLVLSLSKHYAAVIDGVLHDLSDCSRDGTRCVYGYWKIELPEG